MFYFVSYFQLIAVITSKMVEKEHLSKSFVWAISSQLCQNSENKSENCEEIFCQIIKFLNDKFNTNFAINLSKCEIDNFNSLIRCYSIHNRNLTSNKYIIYTKRFELEFEDIKQISSGSFGDVFIAKHKYDKAKYALKRIRIKNESE